MKGECLGRCAHDLGFSSVNENPLVRNVDDGKKRVAVRENKAEQGMLLFDFFTVGFVIVLLACPVVAHGL